MSLDACVYCDCFEKGRLREPPPVGVSLRVEPDGSLGRERDDGTLESDLAWDQWRERSACEHPGGALLRHHLGNISLIGFLRSQSCSEIDHGFPFCSPRYSTAVPTLEIISRSMRFARFRESLRP